MNDFYIGIYIERLMSLRKNQRAIFSNGFFIFRLDPNGKLRVIPFPVSK